MTVYFHIHYVTTPGQVLVLCGNSPETGKSMVTEAPVMHHHGDGNWSLTVEHQPVKTLVYKYYVCEGDHIVREECGKPHRLSLSEKLESCTVNDFWQPEPDTPILHASAFSDSLLSVTDTPLEPKYKPGSVIIRVAVPLVRENQVVAISGDSNVLGNWNPLHAITMTPGTFPEWHVRIDAGTLPPSFHYKFLLINKENPSVAAWEWGEPRELTTNPFNPNNLHVEAGLTFRCQEAPWKGAGVSIPVFSLRSETSWGCGDFGDLLELIAWVSDTGQQLIQLLPINDTTHSGTWTDSYPYNAISVYALHPIYVCPSMLPPLRDEALAASLEARRIPLNQLPEVDYQASWELKKDFLKALFKQEGQACMASDAYRSFVADNRDWLEPYAAFCYLRDTKKSADFSQWGTYATYSPSLVTNLCDSQKPWHDEIAYHLVIQYWLHLQLKGVRDEAHRKRVIIKGDIPIGVNRQSVDAWSEAHLFNTSVQVGAPPDEFSTTGQNWGFPSYNWESMKREGYRWWRKRLAHMSVYFDAYRIDHILGFFRIWEIPEHATRGLLGQFNPALPYTVIELIEYGIDFSDEMTMPLFTPETISEMFGANADYVTATFLKQSHKGCFTLKTFCNTQQKIHDWLNKNPQQTEIKEGLLSLCEEVLFLHDATNPTLLHPRINGFNTRRFNHLSKDRQDSFRQLHDDFFFRRQNDFWKNAALEKLTPLVQSTHMLACGEDLGMIPSCVPDVMRNLQLLSLEIQRMPKQQGVRFENLNSIPYLSVCSTSTHDLNPLRAWWLEDKETTTQYYQQVLWKPGVTPTECTPEIAIDIILQHLASPAMWVIIPWQDWLAIDAVLRRQHPESERINIPSNPRHYWRYRMHLTIGQLKACTYLTASIRSLIQRTGRI